MNKFIIFNLKGNVKIDYYLTKQVVNFKSPKHIEKLKIIINYFQFEIFNIHITHLAQFLIIIMIF